MQPPGHPQSSTHVAQSSNLLRILCALCAPSLRPLRAPSTFSSASTRAVQQIIFTFLFSFPKPAHQSTYVSCITAFTCSISLAERGSNVFTILDRSILLIWSSTTHPFFLLCFTSTRVGYGLEAVVMGATTMVCRYLFISFGEMITQGRVFLISLP